MHSPFYIHLHKLSDMAVLPNASVLAAAVAQGIVFVGCLSIPPTQKCLRLISLNLT